MPDYMNLTFLEKCQTQLYIFEKKHLITNLKLLELNRKRVNIVSRINYAVK